MFISKTEKSIMYDYLICLSSLIFMSIYYYGWRALIVISVSVATCYICDMVCVYQRKKVLELNDFSAIVTGIIFAMLMPASVPYNILIISCVIMVIIGKQAFGGNENPIFNTVAVGYAFASLCWKDAMSWFPLPSPKGQVDLASNVSNLTHSFTYNVDLASMPSVSKFDMVLGIFSGPMGTTHIIVILVCAIVLISRRSISVLTFLSCLGTLLATAFLFPPAIRETRFSSIVFELLSGATLFVIVFIACDIRNSPKTKFGRILYGIIIALLTILFRRYAKIEVGMIFAVLIANVLSQPLDNNSANMAKSLKLLFKSMKSWPKKFINLVVFLITKFYKGIIILIISLYKVILFIFKKIFRLIKKLFVWFKNRKNISYKGEHLLLKNQDEHIDLTEEKETDEILYIESDKSTLNDLTIINPEVQESDNTNLVDEAKEAESETISGITETSIENVVTDNLEEAKISNNICLEDTQINYSRKNNARKNKKAKKRVDDIGKK